MSHSSKVFVRSNELGEKPSLLHQELLEEHMQVATSLIKLDVENDVKFGESNLGICSKGYGVSLQNT